jgi:hypothetical protein
MPESAALMLWSGDPDINQEFLTGGSSFVILDSLNGRSRAVGAEAPAKGAGSDERCTDIEGLAQRRGQSRSGVVA